MHDSPLPTGQDWVTERAMLIILKCVAHKRNEQHAQQVTRWHIFATLLPLDATRQVARLM